MSIQFSTRIKGERETLLHLDQLPARVQERLRAVMARVGVALQAEARERAPKLTGKMAASLNAKFFDAEGRYTGAEVKAKPAKPMAAFTSWHEFGLPRKTAVADVSAHVRAGIEVSAYRRRVRLPARSFTRAALAAQKSGIAASLRQAVREGLRG